jgi:hypothetical protein
MPMATLLFSGHNWLWPAVAFFAFALLFLWWGYRQTSGSGGHRAAAFFLKALGFTALILCLLEPLWSGTRSRPGANLFAIVADNSQGMQIRDRGAPQTRGESLRTLLTDPQGDWHRQIREDFDVRRYVFDSRLQQTKDFGELTFDGRASSIGEALRTLADRYRGRPLAGVLLFTDGNATDIPSGVPNLSGLPPIYPVVIGTDQTSKDVALQNVTVSQTSFEDAPVTIQATVVASGYSGVSLVGQLFDNTGKKVEEQTQRVLKEDETLGFRFQFRPQKNGISFYRFRVSARDEIGQFANPQTSTEATLANNSRVLVVDRGKGPHRVLYVTGRPNWEYKFLNRALAEDEQTQLIGLIRIAKREPKFDFRGRTGESSNPLFRGFDKKTEETERYDQPVLVRLNIKDDSELRGGFPKTAEELYSYEAVIVDDLEAEFFTHDQMVLLQKFVSERGGGFMMLGGQESFHQGKFERTPIGDMLPVYLDRVADTRPLANLRMDLTREGWLQPWARLRLNEVEERSRLEVKPASEILNRVRDVKPGASVVATVRDSGENQYPALVVQRFGHGRTAALMIGDFWKGTLRTEEMQRDLAKGWRQMVRWLIADVPQRIEMQTEQQADANQSVLLQLRIRDKKFQPLDNATASVEVQTVIGNPDGGKPRELTGLSTNQNVVRIHTEAALNEPGLYQATYIPRETGAYQAEAIVTDASGIEIGRVETGWTANPAAEEFRSLKPNRALLEKIAQQTGGEVVSTNNLAAFVRSLPKRAVPITETWTLPLWHTPVVFLFALACFIAEWGLRRRKGLA